jgi:hypothetical protein
MDPEKATQLRHQAEQLRAQAAHLYALAMELCETTQFVYAETMHLGEKAEQLTKRPRYAVTEVIEDSLMRK